MSLSNLLAVNVLPLVRKMCLYLHVGKILLHTNSNVDHPSRLSNATFNIYLIINHKNHQNNIVNTVINHHISHQQ